MTEMLFQRNATCQGPVGPTARVSNARQC